MSTQNTAREITAAALNARDAELRAEGLDRFEVMDALKAEFGLAEAGDDNYDNTIFTAEGRPGYLTRCHSLAEWFTEEWQEECHGRNGAVVSVDAYWYWCQAEDTSLGSPEWAEYLRGYPAEIIAEFADDVEISDTARILSGKRCDLETATHVRTLESPVESSSDFDYVEGEVYRAPEGHLFAVGSGGARSIFGRYTSPGWLAGGSGWALLSDAE